jgi:nucleoside 2-deoxyribosyltransferase
VNAGDDYPLYYCKEPAEVIAILNLLFKEGFTFAPYSINPHNNLSITAKGYQRLREIKKPNLASRLCFVAMCFTPEMNDVFDKAIKPAIEFVEPCETIPRYQAVKIDNVEHVNDINDEIIAQIRRSRFMVCDLSGYRGGVYFEAGFAHGLGLEVIYTCRKDWTKEEILTDSSGNEVSTLFDSESRQIAVKKEGVHFDLAHRNRIEWEPDKLEDFKTKLKNRIKAVIF